MPGFWGGPPFGIVLLFVVCVVCVYLCSWLVCVGGGGCQSHHPHTVSFVLSLLLSFGIYLGRRRGLGGGRRGCLDGGGGLFGGGRGGGYSSVALLVLATVGLEGEKKGGSSRQTQAVLWSSLASERSATLYHGMHCPTQAPTLALAATVTAAAAGFLLSAGAGAEAGLLLLLPSPPLKGLVSAERM